MYLDKDSKGRFHVMDIDKDTLHGLRRMIEGACLEQRRTFNRLLEDIKMEENKKKYSDNKSGSLPTRFNLKVN